MEDDIGIPSLAGAYVLVIELSVPLSFRIAGERQARLVPGRYAYCGSARGPGGLAARLARHLRRSKPIHWHVDHLTRIGRIDGIAYQPDGKECALLRQILKTRGATIPVPGLGSSDCTRCPAHLVAVEQGFTANDLGLPVVVIPPQSRPA